MKKALLTLIVLFATCGSYFAQHETHWPGVDLSTTYEGYGSLVAYVSIDGTPIAHTDNYDDFEVAAFVNGTLRGTAFLDSYDTQDPYPIAEMEIWYDPVAGDTGKEVTFKLYDHQNLREYTICTSNVTILTGDEHTEVYFSPVDDDVMLSFFTPTFPKTISPYAGNGGWYLIASPIGNVAPEDVENMTSNNFDLYRFNQSESLEWENYKDNTHGHYHYALESGKGYLYANNGNNTGDVQLTFTGFPYNGDGKVTLVKDASAPNFSGWNLVGNPFAQDAYITKAFYIMNETRTGLCVGTGNKIGPMEGIFVEAETNGEEMIFSTTASGKTDGQLIVNLTGGHRGGVIDRAIVRFDNSEELHKFQLFEGNAMLYIPQNGQDFAMVNADQQGELPLHFKAAKNGTYTLSFNTEGLTMNYLHLIDNLTGNDVDLLATPSYTFEASITNYASRFKLVFATSNTSDDNFAFISNGKLIVNGTGTLQVFDVLGHELIVKQLSVFHFTSHSVGEPFGVPLSASLFSPGVYVLRLVNGNDIKTQKIIVK